MKHKVAWSLLGCAIATAVCVAVVFTKNVLSSGPNVQIVFEAAHNICSDPVSSQNYTLSLRNYEREREAAIRRAAEQALDLPSRYAEEAIPSVKALSSITACEIAVVSYQRAETGLGLENRKMGWRYGIYRECIRRVDEHRASHFSEFKRPLLADLDAGNSTASSDSAKNLKSQLPRTLTRTRFLLRLCP